MNSSIGEIRSGEISFWRVLDGDFVPSTDPDKRRRSLAMLAVELGNSESGAEGYGLYRPSWAPGTSVMLEKDVDSYEREEYISLSISERVIDDPMSLSVQYRQPFGRTESVGSRIVLAGSYIDEETLPLDGRVSLNTIKRQLTKSARLYFDLVAQRSKD